MKKIAVLLAGAVLLVAVPTSTAATRHHKSNRARVHALEKQLKTLKRQVKLLTQHLEVVDDEAYVALGSVQCLYGEPVQYSPGPVWPDGNIAPAYPIIRDTINDASALWMVFMASGPDCDQFSATVPTGLRRFHR